MLIKLFLNLLLFHFLIFTFLKFHSFGLCLWWWKRRLLYLFWGRLSACLSFHLRLCLRLYLRWLWVKLGLPLWIYRFTPPNRLRRLLLYNFSFDLGLFLFFDRWGSLYLYLWACFWKIFRVLCGFLRWLFLWTHRNFGDLFIKLWRSRGALFWYFLILLRLCSFRSIFGRLFWSGWFLLFFFGLRNTLFWWHSSKVGDIFNKMAI